MALPQHFVPHFVYHLSGKARIRQSGGQSVKTPGYYRDAPCYPSPKHNSLRQRQFFGVVDGHGLPAHISFPGVAAAFAATTGFFFATESAADFRATGADIHIGDATITAP